MKEFISLGLGFGTLSASAVCAIVHYATRWHCLKSQWGLVVLWCSARQAIEEGLITMHAILMLLYAVGVVLFAAALALAVVCWVIDRVAAFSARY